MGRRVVALAAVAALGSVLASQAPAAPGTGALQVALRARGLYTGPLDGARGPRTIEAVRKLQRRAGLPVTGSAGPRTRRALGKLGKPLPGTRTVTRGAVGWDVAWLEFMLAQRGFDPGKIDGRFDADTQKASVRFAKYARLSDRCHAHPSIFAALRRTKPPRVRARLTWPVRGNVARRFGIHGARLFEGIDIGAAFGAGVAAAYDGRVAFAGQRGPMGLVVVIKHSKGLLTVYGHLARIDVHPGDRVIRGALVGIVGKTGNTREPLLYFATRVRDAAVDPLRLLRY